MKLTTQTPPHTRPKPTSSPTTTYNNKNHHTKHSQIPHAISEKYVTFYNDVNSTYLGKLGALETNLLFAIFNKLRDKQDEFLVLSIR